MATTDNTLLMEEVQIIFRNFSGKESQFNREGDRNFAVLIDENLANTLTEDNWNVKWLKPREDAEDDTPQAYLPVAVSFKGRPPRIILITSRGRTQLEEHQLDMLDWATIINVDLIVRPYHWVVAEKTGVKAYLQSLYVTIEEDALEQKYAERFEESE